MRRHALSILGSSVAVGLVLGFLLSSTGGRFSLEKWLIDAGVSTAYTLVIGSLSTVAIRLLMRRTARLPAFAQFLTILGAILVAAIVGSLITSGLFVAMGLFPTNLFWRQYLPALRISILIAIMAAVGAYGYGRLRGRIERAEQLALAARLASLESRTRPHFLFNALNTVAALIPEDPRLAERTLEQVSALLRASLDAAGRPLVPLRDELALTRDYLEIERARFGQRLRFEVTVDETLLDTPVPSFAVQTLVENAVRHALAPRPEGGTVRITAARRDGRRELVVSDDGPGFDPNGRLPDGHGLDNLRARLQAQYGAAARLDVARGEPGARVAVVLPA